VGFGFDGRRHNRRDLPDKTTPKLCDAHRNARQTISGATQNGTKTLGRRIDTKCGFAKPEKSQKSKKKKKGTSPDYRRKSPKSKKGPKEMAHLLNPRTNKKGVLLYRFGIANWKGRCEEATSGGEC
jgi:hypothetical protein